MTDLREGIYDVLVGVNLLREGLDLPEVSLVAILNADYAGFLRDHRSLTQTAGRAARNVNGLVILYADKMTEGIQKTIEETLRRRKKQMAYNKEHGITPTPIKKEISNALAQEKKSKEPEKAVRFYTEENAPLAVACDPVVEYMSADQLKKSIERTKRLMQEAADRMEFIEAAQYRDEMFKLQELLKNKTKK